MTTTILVPGAWMGGWIWEPTVQILRQHGIDAETITLENGDVGLGDHVRHLIDRVDGKAIFISHSYSGMVTASAADRLGEQVRGLIHVGSFLPVNGHSLLDAWGPTPQPAPRNAPILTPPGAVGSPRRGRCSSLKGNCRQSSAISSRTTSPHTQVER